jgi:hypothetical protein
MSDQQPYPALQEMLSEDHLFLLLLLNNPPANNVSIEKNHQKDHLLSFETS